MREWIFQKKALRIHALSNLKHPDISMYILYTVLYTFPKLLTGRICFVIKGFFH